MQKRFHGHQPEGGLGEVRKKQQVTLTEKCAQIFLRNAAPEFHDARNTQFLSAAPRCSFPAAYSVP